MKFDSLNCVNFSLSADLLYWLDPFELTNPRNRWFAKGICVSACPLSEEVCRMEDVPCTEALNYR